MNPIAYVADALGLPSIDDIIPAPADVAKDLGIPTPDNIADAIKSQLRSKVGRFGR